MYYLRISYFEPNVSFIAQVKKGTYFNANSGYKHLLELNNYKLNVSYVTTYIIRSDYYSVTDKFKL